MKFLKLKYRVEVTNLVVYSDYSNKEQSGDSKSSTYEEEKRKAKDYSKLDKFTLSIKTDCQKRTIIMHYLFVNYL